MRVGDIDVAILSEINSVSRTSGWIADSTAKAAIFLENRNKNIRMNKTIYKGKGIITISCENMNVCSVYVPPRTERREFVAYLKSLALVVEYSKNKDLIIAGYFNSRHVDWDTVNNWKGNMLNKWMHEKRMYLLNNSGVPTCIRPQGSSTVDLTLAKGGAMEGITDWAVVTIESLSDHHVPITYTHRETSCVERNKYVKEYFTRWNINKFIIIVTYLRRPLRF